MKNVFSNVGKYLKETAKILGFSAVVSGAVIDTKDAVADTIDHGTGQKVSEMRFNPKNINADRVFSGQDRGERGNLQLPNLQNGNSGSQYSFVPSHNGADFSVHNNVESLNVGVGTGSIVGVEYKNIGGEAGFLLEVQYGKETKYILVSGNFFINDDTTLKATAGAIAKKISGKNVIGTNLGVELVTEINDTINTSMFMNVTHSRGRTLSVQSLTENIVGGTKTTTTTQAWDGGTRVTGGVSITYLINPNNEVSLSVSKDAKNIATNIGYKHESAEYSGEVNVSHVNNKTDISAQLMKKEGSVSFGPYVKVSDSDVEGGVKLAYNFGKPQNQIIRGKNGNVVERVTGSLSSLYDLPGEIKTLIEVQENIIAPAVEIDGSAGSLTLASKTHNSVSVTMSGVTNLNNVKVVLYTEAGSKVSENTTGIFNGLDPLTEYYAQIEGEDPSEVNIGTSVLRVSSPLHFTTDAVPVVISPNGPKFNSIDRDFSYQVGSLALLPTVTATDIEDGAVSVSVEGNVDFNTPGYYTLIYTAIDSDGHTASITHNYTITAAPVVVTEIDGSAGSLTLASKTHNSVSVTMSGVTNLNNVKVVLYTEAGSKVSENTTGIFNGLDPLTEYYAQIEGEDPSEVNIGTSLLRVSSPLNFTTDAAPNTAPTTPVLTGTTTVKSGDAISLSCTSTDAENNTITYSVSGLPSGLSFNPSTCTITGSTTDTGRHNVTINASDGQANSLNPLEFNLDIVPTSQDVDIDYGFYSPPYEVSLSSMLGNGESIVIVSSSTFFGDAIFSDPRVDGDKVIIDTLDGGGTIKIQFQIVKDGLTSGISTITMDNVLE